MFGRWTCAIYSSAFCNFPSRVRQTPFTRPPSPHTNGHLRGPLISVFSRRIDRVGAPFENYVQDLGLTGIWCGRKFPVNTSPFDFEVLRGLAGIFDNERSLSGLELRWHVDSIVAHRHVHTACVAIRGDGVLHGISGVLHAMSNRPSGLFCSPHG